MLIHIWVQCREEHLSSYNTVLYTHIYTYRRCLPQPCPASLLLPGSPLPVYALTELHSLSSPTVSFFHSPQASHGGNQGESHQLVPPKIGASHFRCEGTGEKSSHPPQLKRKPNPPKQTNKSLCKIKANTTPHTPPHAPKYLLLLNFPFWTLARK